MIVTLLMLGCVWVYLTSHDPHLAGFAGGCVAGVWAVMIDEWLTRWAERRRERALDRLVEHLRELQRRQEQDQ